MLLAARLDHNELREWVERELNGYPSADVLPPYRRGGEVPVLADFAGPYGSERRNERLPPLAVLPSELVNAADGWPVAEAGVGSAAVVVAQKR